MQVNDLERGLAVARDRLRAAVTNMAPRHKGGEWEEYRVANAAVLKLERELARVEGEEYADEPDFPVLWDAGAPLPHVLANDYRTFLIFRLREPGSIRDGTQVVVVNPADSHLEPLALVEFKRCAAFKMGTPNDEVLTGHPLAGKGQEAYRAQIVRNSKWLKELEAINKVHPNYQADRWKTLTHYVLWFHGSTYECVAERYEVETQWASFSSLLGDVCNRLVR